ncbi:MAG: hypothetical protein WB492_10020 [Christiangramia sp.]
MKISFLAIVIMFFAANNCSNNNQDANMISSINYETFTRGSSTMYKLTPEMMEITSTGLNKSESSLELTKEEWNSLLTKVQGLEVSQISQLKAPSDSRASDAALHAILSVRKNDTIYKTNSFDHGNPPAEVKPLVEAILRLAENVE